MIETTTVTTTTVTRKIRRPKPRPRLVKRVTKVVLRKAAVKGARVKGHRAAVPVRRVDAIVTDSRPAQALPAPRETLVLPAQAVKVLPAPKRR